MCWNLKYPVQNLFKKNYAVTIHNQYIYLKGSSINYRILHTKSLRLNNRTRNNTYTFAINRGSEATYEIMPLM